MNIDEYSKSLINNMIRDIVIFTIIDAQFSMSIGCRTKFPTPLHGRVEISYEMRITYLI